MNLGSTPDSAGRVAAMTAAKDIADIVIDAALEGGPEDLPPSMRRQRTTSTSKIKIRHGGCYEHFEHSGEYRPGDDGDVLVFRWTMRTRVAE
jgi:hypothetical protein